jgi:prepilin-type N-terminal cleavage/methylation domain-containing protein
MTLPEPRARTLRGMNPRRARRAFTLIEILVALMMMGVAAAGLVSALTGDHRLRDMAAVRTFAADRARERLELLAALPCAGDTSGTTISALGAERWRASVSRSVSRSAWLLTDSVVPRSPAHVLVFEARVACPD